MQNEREEPNREDQDNNSQNKKGNEMTPFSKITFGETTIEIPDRNWDDKHCTKCLNLELHDDTQLLVCKDCGKFSSAYTYLRNHLGEMGMSLRDLTGIKSEILIKRKVLEKLKRDERNAKSRIRKSIQKCS